MEDVDEASLRAEVRDWLAEHWNPDLGLLEWRSMLVDSGWGCPGWPKEWFGRGLPVPLANAVAEEIRSAGAVGVAQSGVRMLAAATIMEHGTDEQKTRFLRPMSCRRLRYVWPG